MSDFPKIIVGLLVFLALATSPLWINAISDSPATAPEVKPPPGGAVNCVEDKAYMRASHMDLLNQWRDDVVRRNDRWYVFEADGVEKTVEKSLTSTCLSCHSNKTDFCDACHTYTAVDPYCWDCHIVPKEVL